jgi:hypothetical protein
MGLGRGLRFEKSIDGSPREMIMTKRFALFSALVVANAAMADTLLLEPPTPAYPTLLDRSCGGVQTSTYALGFDASGNILGAVHAWTQCTVDAGRYHKIRTYSSWHSLVWDLHGSLLATMASDDIIVDPTLSAVDEHGNTVSSRYVVTDSRPAGYVAVLTRP